MNIRTALDKIGQKKGESNVEDESETTNPNQEGTSSAKTTSRKSSGKSRKSRKRSPSSEAPSTSQQRKNAKKETESTTNPNQEGTSSARTTSRKSSGKSKKSRKRSPSSEAPSTSEPRKKAEKQTELTTNPNQEGTSSARTTSRKNLKYSKKSRKRSPSSEAPSTSQPRKKTKKETELIITPPAKTPELHYDEKGYYPVKDNQVLKNRYELQKMLGNGSYATVHLAKDRQSGSTVAVKIVRTGELYNIASELEVGFMKTANLTSSNSDDSNHIVSLLDNFKLNGPHGLHIVMVMEVLGPDLLSILCNSNQKVLTVQRIKSFSKNILEGLDFLHSKCKIMHLDMKPENLFVTVDPETMDLSDPRCSARLKIGDFGTSAKTTEVVKRIVQTSHYRAPESFLKCQITPEADIWSVGCILYEMIARVMLFPSSKKETCGYKWYLGQISELLGPVKMRYFEKNEKNGDIFRDVFGDKDAFIEKKSRINWISPAELMREHPMKKTDAEKFNKFLKDLLIINPKRRFSAKEALEHSFFE